jgi:hypothetical protein
MLVMAEMLFGTTLFHVTKSSDEGWNLSAIESQIMRINSIAIWFALGFMLITELAFLTGHSWMNKHYEVGSIGGLKSLTAAVLLGILGFVSGYGVWGAVKVILFVWTCCTTVKEDDPKDSLPPWSPLHARQVDGVEALGSFSLLVAIMFSVGAIMVPAISIIAVHTSGPAKAFLFSAVAILLLSSSVLLIGPMLMMEHLCKLQRAAVLDEVASNLMTKYEQLLSGMDIQSDIWRIDALLQYRQAFMSESPRPLSIARFAQFPLAIFIPVVSAVASVYAAFPHGG